MAVAIDAGYGICIHARLAVTASRYLCRFDDANA